MLNDLEVLTNLTFIKIYTLQFELRPINKIKIDEKKNILLIYSLQILYKKNQEY